MTAQNDAKTIQAAYDAFGRGDLDAVASAFAPDIVWHEAGQSPIAGAYKGRDAVFGLFGRLFELTGGTFSVEVHDLLASEGHVVALARLKGTRKDEPFSWDEAHIWHLQDGVATEFWNALTEASDVDEFWS